LDKNIAALMREDAFTVGVQFRPRYFEGETGVKHPSLKIYTYVCDFPVALGDVAAVFAEDKLAFVNVVQIDSEVLIEPNSDIEYKWLICKVDFDHYTASQERNTAIRDAVAAAGRTNMRKGFANQVLAGMDDDARNALLALTAPAAS
jgi:hypothetical protein